MEAPRASKVFPFILLRKRLNVVSAESPKPIAKLHAATIFIYFACFGQSNKKAFVQNARVLSSITSGYSVSHVQKRQFTIFLQILLLF